jgi:hypothetical protein
VGAQGVVKRAVLLALAAALAAASPAGAATLRVSCAKGGNLQAKLNAAAPGSTILIKGTCHGTFTIAKKVALKGNPAATLDGDDGGTVVTVNNVPVRFVDLRIVDGAATNGGGVYSAGGRLTFVRTTVSGNVASNAGGGIAATAPVVLSDSRVTWNKVEQSSSGPMVMGGGVYATSVTLTRSTVRSNLAHAVGAANPTRAYGGGIFLSGAGSLVAKHSHIDKNTARANGPSATTLGGGVTQQAGGPALRFTDSALNGNTSLANAIVGTGFAQGGAVQAGRVIARRTDFVGNRVDLTAALGSGNASGGALLLGTTASTFTSVEIRKTRVEVDAAANGLVQGGAIATSTPTAKLTIARSTISGGTATVHATNGSATAYGGGISSPGDLSLVRSTVAGNSLAASSGSVNATVAGGGVRAEDTLSIRTSTISGNAIKSTVGNALASSVGGGIALVTSPELATIVNSTITRNSAKATANPSGVGPIAIGYGGGIYVANSTLRLTNATVARNRANAAAEVVGRSGGGVYASTATLELRGAILAANTAAVGRDCAGLTTSLGWNLIGSTAGCTITPKASDTKNKPAKLGTFGDHGGPTLTIPLLPGSPALNAIPRASCKVKSDQRGVKRPQQRRCEIGAWERRP